MSEPANLHACAVIVGGIGVLVAGPSGAGKTRLSLDLVEHCRRQGQFGAIVADDQVLLAACSGRLIATVPPTIAGRIELRGFGPAPVGHVPRMVVDRLVRLVAVDAAPRLAEHVEERLHGVALPRLDVATGPGEGSIRAVIGWLGLPPFAP